MNELQQKLEALNRKFRDQLPAQLAGIEAAMTEAEMADPADLRARLAALHRALHGLSGAAGTFGHHLLGEEAYAVELRLQQLASLPDAALREALTTFRPDLRALLASARTRDLA